jgi:DNA-binding response OmpR family regulator
VSQRARILLVEDDQNLGFVVHDQLQRAGFQVHLCRDGKEGLRYFNTNAYDLCILDVMLPQKDGFSLAADIRTSDAHVPILFLSAKSMTQDKVQGFRAGADDYMTKPFSQEELQLRIEAILRRTFGRQDPQRAKDEFTLASYTFDHRNLLLRRQGVQRGLTKKEAEVLRLLCIHQDQVLPRELVLNMVWGDDTYFLGRSLDVFISRLRKYLRDDPAVQIVNVHGVGFKLQVG